MIVVLCDKCEHGVDDIFRLVADGWTYKMLCPNCWEAMPNKKDYESEWRRVEDYID